MSQEIGYLSNNPPSTLMEDPSEALIDIPPVPKWMAPLDAGYTRPDQSFTFKIAPSDVDTKWKDILKASKAEDQFGDWEGNHLDISALTISTWIEYKCPHHRMLKFLSWSPLGELAEHWLQPPWFFEENNSDRIELRQPQWYLETEYTLGDSIMEKVRVGQETLLRCNYRDNCEERPNEISCLGINFKFEDLGSGKGRKVTVLGPGGKLIKTWVDLRPSFAEVGERYGAKATDQGPLTTLCKEMGLPLPRYGSSASKLTGA